MKVSTLQNYLAATLAKFGDVDCYIDIDPEDEDYYDIDGVYVDVSPTDENDGFLVFSAYEVRAKLKSVK